MFNTIRLEASPSDLARLSDPEALQTVRPYVRRVAFVRKRYSWIMDYQLFATVSRRKSLRYYDMIRTLWTERREEFDRGHTHVVDRYARRWWPVSEVEVRRCFDAYVSLARDTKHLFDSRQFEDSWSDVLRILPSVKAVAIERWNYEGSENAAQVDEHFAAHRHTVHHSSNDCRLLQVPVGEALFATAISSLKRAATPIQELDVSHITSANLGLADNGELDGLNLSELQTLFFRPDVYLTPGTDNVASRIQSGFAVTSLVRQCSRSLKRLEVGDTPSQHHGLFLRPTESAFRSLGTSASGADGTRTCIALRV